MRIHLAVDLIALGPALELAESVCDHVDSMWLGPTLLKNEGLRAVEAFKTSFCHKPIVADMRSTHDGGLEAELAFGAQADVSTILAIAADEDIRAAVEFATRHKRRIFANLIGVRNPVQRAAELTLIGVSGVVHKCAPLHGLGLSSEEMRQITDIDVPVFLDSCDSTEELRMVALWGVEDVVVGRPIYAARDAILAAQAFHEVAIAL
jgi:3-hexulose-6-phosphate synthase